MGGYELYEKLLKKLNLDIKGFFAFPMPTQPLGWFKKSHLGVRRSSRLQIQNSRLSSRFDARIRNESNPVTRREIIPAMERGVLDAFEFNNPTSDRRLGAQDVCKNYALGSFHQAMEFLRFFLTELNLMH